MAAHEAELDLRLKHAEAELAKLRRELYELRAGTSTPASVAAQEQPAAAEAQVGELAAEAPPPDTEAVSSSVEKPDVASPLPLTTTEQEVARAVELLDEFTGVVDQHHAQSLARVVALEQEISAMRTLVERERQTAGASADG